MSGLLWAIFGAKGQVVIGAATFVAGVVFWGVIEALYADDLQADPVVAAIFRVSMFFGLVACYAIVATGLGYRATERVEAKVEEADITAKHADVEADDVDVR